MKRVVQEGKMGNVLNVRKDGSLPIKESALLWVIIVEHGQ